MNKILGITLLTLTFLVNLSYSQQTQLPPARHEPGMKAQFETLYQHWRNAMLQKDLNAWGRTVARYRQLETRNRIVSQKQPFPQSMFGDIAPPSLRNLIFLTVLTRRDTASAVYFGKADFGIGDASQIKNNLLVLRYLKEGGQWRFDNIRVVTLGNDTSILHDIRLQKFDFLKGEEFQPLDSIPHIPQPVPSPEMMGEVWITSVGYETEIWVNGHRTGKITNSQGKELVMGGIRRGNNQIVLRVRKKDIGSAVPKFEAAIYAAEEPGKPAKRIFHFKPTEAINDGDVQKQFYGKGF